MRTQLHTKLRSIVKRMNKEGHWYFVDGAPRIIYVKGAGIVTTKRAIYAAFKGDIPEGMELRPSCTMSMCVAPEHQVLSPARGVGARALSLPHLDTLTSRKNFVDETPGNLPKGLTKAQVLRVKSLHQYRNTMQQIRSSTGLSSSIIMKIVGGVFDRAIRPKNVVEHAPPPKVKEDPPAAPPPVQVLDQATGVVPEPKMEEPKKKKKVEELVEDEGAPTGPDSDSGLTAWMRTIS